MWTYYISERLIQFWTFEKFNEIFPDLGFYTRSRISIFWIFTKNFSFGIILVRIFPHSRLVSLRIQSESGKIRTRIAPNMDTFYAVYFCLNTYGMFVIFFLNHHEYSKLTKQNSFAVFYKTTTLKLRMFRMQKLWHLF